MKKYSVILPKPSKNRKYKNTFILIGLGGSKEDYNSVEYKITKDDFEFIFELDDKYDSSLDKSQDDYIFTVIIRLDDGMMIQLVPLEMK